MIARADSFRDLLQNALTLDGTLTANRQNEVRDPSAEQNEQVKKISSWAAILFAPSFVAGIYGMNFDTCPRSAGDWVTRSRSSRWPPAESCCTSSSSAAAGSS